MPIIQTEKQLRKRSPRDFYPTPYGLADSVVARLKGNVEKYTHAIDPGYGTGIWGKALRAHFPNIVVSGVDLKENKEATKYYDHTYHMDYLDFADMYTVNCDLIIGNPPYGQAEEFIRASMKLLNEEDGAVVFLLRNSFLHSQKRYHGLYKDHPLNNVYFLSRRPSFTGDGKTDADDYIIATWYKRSVNLRTWDGSVIFLGEHLMWDYAEEDLDEKDD